MKKSTITSAVTSAFFCLWMALAAAPVHAHGADAHKKPPQPQANEQLPWGIAGNPKAVRRTVVVSMGDDMRFKPDKIDVRLGETVRFTVKNSGGVLHEFVIGTPTALAEHAALMLKFPNMEHGEAYMAHVAPGKKASIVWTFNRPGTFEFACLIAGHFQAGMKGLIVVAN